MPTIITGIQIETATNKVSELKLVSPDGLIEKSIILSNAGVVTIDSINPLEKTLFKEYTVSGSAVTTIDFTGLDINAHNSYSIELDITNVTASGAQIHMFINADTTVTNYYSQYSLASGTSLAGTRANNPTVSSFDANNIVKCNISLSKVIDKVRAISSCCDLSDATVRVLNYSYAKVGTVTNITQITFTSTVASSIAIGSKIRIYRGDL
jgi:hypothetical protein